MTRDEAAEFTIKLVERAETIVFPKTPKTINNIPVFYFEAVLSALRGPEWVRTADKLPLHFSNTLVVMGGKITLGLYDCNCWFFYNEDKNKWEMDKYDRVTHWMPVPKLPEVEE